MNGATKDKILREELATRLIAIRRQLHANPELSHEEFLTTDAIREWLAEEQIRILDYSLRTGVIAEIGGKRPGPTIALRADIDALPVQEETGLPFASRVPGRMHACGHDYHTASLLGAAFLLKEKESELNGTVRLIFQPAEEKAKGALEVIESGALEGVGAIFGLHNKPDLPVGTIGIKEGPLMAAADGFVVRLEGVGSHAAVPEAGVDPIVAGAHLIAALQTIVSRNVSPLKSAVISVTRIHSGTSWNVIPEHALLDGTLRTFDEEVRSTVRERFEQVTEGIAAAFGVKASVKWIDGPPAVINDKRWAEVAAESARSVGLHAIVPTPSPAGEDFAYYRRAVPGAFFFMGTSGPREWHHPSFDIDELALPLTAAFFARLAQDGLDKLSPE
ncbi:amidohydrolase [Cohnella thailandensis]|uniref:Amidohydrolase n=1 Tax=Cohnella thailandensis TaxID=557557 RepID=A0A841SU98_9BACL|nr:amidohydrolase [Cohnella thailandensis]MBB6633788.1 amidohydrolase [Cohnella thailandensis]MBP1976579.1 amidohydrolase [Cohnella thailandensis]